MDKKLYIIDRNGRMHVIEIDDTLVVNKNAITDEKQLEDLLHEIWDTRTDLYIKNSKRLKVFDTKKLIGYQIVPLHE